MMSAEQSSGCMPGNSMRVSKSAPCSPIKPIANWPVAARVDPFHVVHKVPVGDSPYVKAKHVQLVDRDPDRAIALFWAAINSGDRVDSALKDMAIVMKQQNRPQEAIEAIKSLRSRCSDQAQESLDNVLLDLFKRCGRLDDQIDLLKRKLNFIHQGMAFNGKRTKTARSQGKKFQVSVEQEATRLLGNLGWAYMQQSNFMAAEAVYRKALSIESDNNKVCNLGICLMKQGRLDEAKSILQSVTLAHYDSRASESHLKSFERAQEMLDELEKGYHDNKQLSLFTIPGCDNTEADSSSSSSLWQPQPALPRQPRRLSREHDQCMTGALLATSGFGPDHTLQANSCRLDMAGKGGFRSSQPERSSLWWLHGGLEDDDSFDYSSPDESSDGSDASTTGSELSSTARDLARSMELVQPFTVKESSTNTTTTHGDAASGNNRQPLASDLTNGHHHQAGVKDERKPLVSAGMWTTPCRSTHSVFENNWNRGDHDENQSSTPRRLEFGGIQATEPSSLYPQAVNSAGLPPLHAAPGKQINRTATPTTTNTWDLMGFTYNPSDLAFGTRATNNSDEVRAPSKELNDNLSASEMEIRRQRRLRVFQEMTPSKTLKV